MKIFVNEKAVSIVKLSDKFDNSDYDLVISEKKALTSDLLKGDVLVKDADLVQMMDLIKIMEVKELNELKSIVFAFEKKKKAVKYFKDHFTIIEAGGGVVRKGEKILMIFRKGKWDLPKGKAEKGETREETSRREVEEECSVKVEIVEKVGKTYHTYLHKGKRVLKKTYWYSMDILEDQKMRPQLEEDIEKVEWMKSHEIDEALKNSYKSICYIIDRYRTKLVVHTN